MQRNLPQNEMVKIGTNLGLYQIEISNFDLGLFGKVY